MPSTNIEASDIPLIVPKVLCIEPQRDRGRVFRLLFHNRIVEEYLVIQAEAAIASMSLLLSNDFTGLLRHICLK
jgi:hypothetical protein